MQARDRCKVLFGVSFHADLAEERLRENEVPSNSYEAHQVFAEVSLSRDELALVSRVFYLDTTFAVGAVEEIDRLSP